MSILQAVRRARFRLTIVALFACLIGPALLPAIAIAQTGNIKEAVTAFLTAPLFTTAIMLGWGLLVKYVPALANWPNNAIWLMNLVIGVIAKLAAPDPAHAASLGDVGASIVNVLGWALPILQVIFARQLHETFIRPTVDLANGIPGAPR